MRRLPKWSRASWQHRHIFAVKFSSLRPIPRSPIFLKDQLEKNLGPDTVRNLQAKYDDPQPALPLCLASSLHAATGLEAPSVILLGLDSLLEKEKDPTLTAESAAELRAAQTRLIYVALTRAAGRLSIISTQPARWIKLLGIATETESTLP